MLYEMFIQLCDLMCQRKWRLTK